MYPEFVAIYIMLGVIIAVLGVVIFLLIKLMKNGASSSQSTPYIPPIQPTNEHYYPQQQYQAPSYQMQYQQPSSNIVYCKQCSAQFDAAQAYCPNCGARR